ncbi:MAG TPA: porin family protein [Flavilitoribacter sp.]|nr:porin family protein [Flavilitoribacter sp.]HMQ87672.1 porin family protein [Flavilitoribacter sp.]
MQSTIKSLAASVLLITLSATLSAQTSRFSISVNSLTTNFDYGKSNAELRPYKKNYKGLKAGISYQAGISPSFSLVPELYFAIKGGSLKEDNPLTVSKSTLRLSSLEMPVLARLHCHNLYLDAGPYTAYTLGGRIKGEGGSTLPETPAKIPFGHAAGDFKRWDAGFQAGVGYNFNMKKSILTTDLRYGYGLVNISRDVERYNRVLSISVLVAKSGK